MPTLMSVIKERKQRLEKSDLGLFMVDNDYSIEERMSFIPSMLFFVMGFKDILETLEVPNTKDPVQRKVNVHCREDEGHWRWFLSDLKRLDIQDSYLHEPDYRTYELMWNNRHKAVREMIYHTIHISKQVADSPGIKLVIVEVLEAAFAAFLSNMHQLIKEAELFDTLEYFGQTHQDTEDAHSIGSWLDASHNNELEDDINADQLAFTHQVVADLFDHFDRMFECWYQNRSVKKNRHMTV